MFFNKLDIQPGDILQKVSQSGDLVDQLIAIEGVNFGLGYLGLGICKDYDYDRHGVPPAEFDVSLLKNELRSKIKAGRIRVIARTGDYKLAAELVRQWAISKDEILHLPTSCLFNK